MPTDMPVYKCICNQRIQVQVVNKAGVKKLVGVSYGDTVETATETPQITNLVAAGFLTKVSD